MRDKIIEFVKEKGPVLPVEVASKVGMNSFLAAGYLEELVESNQISSSKEKVGASRLFFVKGQESKVKERLSELGVKSTKTATIYKDKPVKETPELTKKRKEFADRLEKIESEEKVVKKPERKAPKIEVEIEEEPKMKVIPKQPAVKAARSFVREKIKRFTPTTSRPATDKLIDTALNYLRDNNIKILDDPKEVTSKESEVVVGVPSEVGTIKFLVKIKSKKKLNKADLLQVFVEANERHMPAILLGDGELNATAKKYLKEVGGFIRVKLF